MKGNLPDWFSQRLPDPQSILKMEKLLQGLKLHTICNNALCPNIGECFSRGTATFLILGDTCTRNCTFCAVPKGIPTPVDENEPRHLLEAIEKLRIKYVVITSVTRDDLPDGGASQFEKTVNLLRRNLKNISVEILIPDFQGSLQALNTVMDAFPEVLNHNVETVPRLYPEVRPMADYDRSIRLLSEVKRVNPQMVTKSGLMLGLGETREEVIEVMRDLRETGCDLITLGQYLQPSAVHHPVLRYIAPEEFAEYKLIGKEMGFAGVASSPLVRSSFEAEKMYNSVRVSPKNEPDTN